MPDMQGDEMKRCVVLVLALLVVFSVGGICGDKEEVKAQLEELAGQQAHLETLWTQLATERNEVLQDATPVFKQATELVRILPPPKPFTDKEKLVIMTALYYKEYITRLDMQMKMVELAMNEVKAKMDILINRYNVLQKGGVAA
jgi:hypothetical protein